MNTLIALSGLAVVTLFLGIFAPKKWLLPVIVAGLLTALGLNFADWGHTIRYYNDMYITDNFSVAFGGLMIIATLFVFLLSVQYYKFETRSLEGIYAIIIFTLIGGLVMVSASNLITFFIGIEILSIALYLLAGSHRSSKESHEAAMKYFLMGSFASAFLLFGIALVYGASGSMHYAEIEKWLYYQHGNIPMLAKAGILLIAIGMAFKVAAVPFHFWAPDVYHGSPTLITTFMITTAKVAGFGAFLRLTTDCLGNDYSIWSNSLMVISGLSIIIGNLAAIAQSSPKRMLAYSSIAHTGYILMALVSLQDATTGYMLYYAVAYVLSNIAAFIVLIVIKQSLGKATFDSFNGLAKTNPLLALCMGIAMLSLTGIPPLAGFMGKYFVFASALQGGFVWLTVVAILGSIISIFYYFRPLVNMYFKATEDSQPIITSKLTMLVLVIATLLSLIVGIMPGIFLR